MTRLVFLIAISLLLSMHVVIAQEFERIKLFGSDITVATDGTIEVKETIKVHASGDKIHHGIFRTLPESIGFWGERVGGGRYNIVRVTRNGDDEDFHLDYSDNALLVYIGSEDVILPTGEHTYEIVYQLNSVLRSFENHDELYWNVTGNDWDFQIDSAYAMVNLPTNARIQLQRVSAYSGVSGSTECTCVGRSNGSNVAQLSVTSPLRSYEGFTIAIPFDKGAIIPLSGLERVVVFFENNRNLLICLVGLILVILYYLVAWVKVGRDPKGRLNVPAYTPPDDMRPYTMRYIRQMGDDEKVLVSAIAFLAQQGYIFIEQSSRRRFNLLNLYKDPADLPDVEQQILKAIFKDKDTLELTGKYVPQLKEAKDLLSDHLAKNSKHLFVTNLGYVAVGSLLSYATILLAALQVHGFNRVGAIFLSLASFLWNFFPVLLGHATLTAVRRRQYAKAVGVAIFFILFSGMGIFILYQLSQFVGVLPVVVLVSFTILATIFFFLLKAPTKEGKELMERIDDFAKFLKTAEIPRMQQVTSTMDLDLALFDKYLPYAIALDLETEWAGQFQTVAPNANSGKMSTWYSSSSTGISGATAFSSSMSSFSSSVSSGSSTPSSSGSGGGGSSGGGSGGGGGGGW